MRNDLCPSWLAWAAFRPFERLVRTARTNPCGDRAAAPSGLTSSKMVLSRFWVDTQGEERRHRWSSGPSGRASSAACQRCSTSSFARMFLRCVFTVSVEILSERASCLFALSKPRAPARDVRAPSMNSKLRRQHWRLPSHCPRAGAARAAPNWVALIADKKARKHHLAHPRRNRGMLRAERISYSE